MAVNVDELIEQLGAMSVLDLVKLSKALQDQWGVSAAPAMMAMPTGVTQTTGDGGAPAVEEQTEFNVVLQEIGPNKINVIKAVRELTSLGLKEAKELVDSAPKPVREGVTKDEANAAKAKLEEAGAKAAIQ